jgi:non-canonical purine NTP pyrophosphatase (RdgB/HAM1 family)
MARLPVFITGNQNKADYLSRQLGLQLDFVKVELDEIQESDPKHLLEHKLRQAYETVGRPVLVEDVSLAFTALAGLPGPYIKWFIDGAGADACCRMLDGFDNRSAEAICTFGYFDGTEFTYFQKRAPGTISEHPRGENGFGWDLIFINEGYEITRAEMDQATNESTYAEIMKPFTEVRAFVQSLI